MKQISEELGSRMIDLHKAERESYQSLDLNQSTINTQKPFSPVAVVQTIT